MSRITPTLLIILILNLPVLSIAASPVPTPIAIGMVADLWGPTDDMLGLKSRLAELGYHQNENIALGVRFAEGRQNQLEPIIRQLVQQGASILYVSEWSVLQAAQRATRDIPIVFTTWTHPNHADGTDRPLSSGENMTGVTHAFPGISPASLERFHLLIPSLKRILLPYDATNRRLDAPLQAVRNTASQLGIELVERAIMSQAQAKQDIMTAHQRDIDGILPIGGTFNIAGYTIEAALKHQIPSLYSRAWMAEHGGLASYGPSWYDLGQKAADLVDKIIRGTRPNSLPVVVSHHMRFTVNLRTAKRLGLNIPPSVIAQADHIIR